MRPTGQKELSRLSSRWWRRLTVSGDRLRPTVPRLRSPPCGCAEGLRAFTRPPTWGDLWTDHNNLTNQQGEGFRIELSDALPLVLGDDGDDLGHPLDVDVFHVGGVVAADGEVAVALVPLECLQEVSSISSFKYNLSADIG